VIDKKIASSAAVLLVGGISQFSFPGQIQPIKKFATEPFVHLTAPEEFGDGCRGGIGLTGDKRTGGEELV
jgi:hypothetical protein